MTGGGIGMIRGVALVIAPPRLFLTDITAAVIFEVRMH
jgi:hypothetical protein